MKIKPHRFVTQFEYRGEGKKIILGWIGDFKGSGIRTKKGEYLTYKASLNGTHWTRTWTSYTGALEYLLEKHGKDPIQGTNRVVPIPQTWARDWKPLDYCEDFIPNTSLTSDD